MSKMLSELVGAKEPDFSVSINALERASGNQNVDIRLSADIVAKSNVLIRSLGLDPRDTNGPELYGALISTMKLHDEFLVRAIGANDAANVQELLPKIVTIAQRLKIPRNVWVLKHTIAKKLLKTYPPKRLMKMLGYRSIDSFLKRESIGEIFCALRFAETPSWLEKFVQQYEKLKPSDFETRAVEIVYLDEKKWGKATAEFVSNQHHNVVHSKEVGSIIVLPMPISDMRGITITILPYLIHFINELRIYSTYFKLQQVKPNFGKIVANVILVDPIEHMYLAGQPIHWRVVHQHFGRQPKNMHPEVFEPHVQAEDLEWREAEEILYYLEPALHFWQGMDFVGVVKDNQIISFNLMDVAVNYLNQLPFEDQINYHLKQSLLSQLHRRYLSISSLESHLLHRLDQELFEPDKVHLGAIRV